MQILPQSWKKSSRNADIIRFLVVVVAVVVVVVGSVWIEITRM